MKCFRCFRFGPLRLTSIWEISSRNQWGHTKCVQNSCCLSPLIQYTYTKPSLWPSNYQKRSLRNRMCKQIWERKQRLVRAALEYRGLSRTEKGRHKSSRQSRVLAHIIVNLLLHGELMLKLSSCHRFEFLLPPEIETDWELIGGEWYNFGIVQKRMHGSEKVDWNLVRIIDSSPSLPNTFQAVITTTHAALRTSPVIFCLNGKAQSHRQY